jgi:hypothetical protein
MVQKSKGAFFMILHPRWPQQPPVSRFPSDRYARTNPLRRESGLHALCEPLPKPLQAMLTKAWRHATPYDGNESIHGLSRQRPTEASLFTMPPRMIAWVGLIELGVTRRILEAPVDSIQAETRLKLLASQGAYFAALYKALCAQLGSAQAALAEFQRLIDTIS